jgi:hypothetical protein
MRILFLVLLSIFYFLPGDAQNVKGLYVNQFSSILGNIPAEDSLLNYAQSNGFNYLALYELHLVQAQHDLTNFSASAPLAAFINKAKTQYGILNVGAVAENYWFFQNRIHVYNQLHSNANEKFDVFNLEFEFWQTASTGPSGYYCTTYLQPAGFPCDTSGAFDFYINELRKIDSLAATEGHISETYVGWPNAGQCHEIVATCDRVLVHAYVTNDNIAYGYTQTRLSYFGTAASTANIIVIFSSEPAFMGPWLNSNPEYTAWNTYSGDFSNETATWVSGINLIGYQWFDYTDMPYDLSMSVDPSTFKVPYYVTRDGNTLLISSSVAAPVTCTVYSATGEVVAIQNTVSSSFSIDMNPFANGFYVMTILDHNTNETFTRKIAFTHE